MNYEDYCEDLLGLPEVERAGDPLALSPQSGEIEVAVWQEMGALFDDLSGQWWRPAEIYVPRFRLHLVASSDSVIQGTIPSTYHLVTLNWSKGSETDVHTHQLVTGEHQGWQVYDGSRVEAMRAAGKRYCPLLRFSIVRTGPGSSEFLTLPRRKEFPHALHRTNLLTCIGTHGSSDDPCNDMDWLVNCPDVAPQIRWDLTTLSDFLNWVASQWGEDKQRVPAPYCPLLQFLFAADDRSFKEVVRRIWTARRQIRPALHRILPEMCDLEAIGDPPLAISFQTIMERHGIGSTTLDKKLKYLKVPRLSNRNPALIDYEHYQPVALYFDNKQVICEKVGPLTGYHHGKGFVD